MAFSIVADYLGTPTEMVDDAGHIAWQAQLDIFGVPKVATGEPGDCPWRWPGQYSDEETGLSYNRFRYYDPERGNFISPDPVGMDGGLRLFGYPPDPLVGSDPFGLTCEAYRKRTKEEVAALRSKFDSTERRAFLKALAQEDFAKNYFTDKEIENMRRGTSS